MPAEQRSLLMMPHAFAVRNWSELFETGESRKRPGALEWVKMRTKHDGRSFRRVARLRNGQSVLLGWYLLLQVAAKMPCRGVLADLDGPLDARDLADKTGFPEALFRAALTELIKQDIGWIEQIDWQSSSHFWDNIERLERTPAYKERQEKDAERKRQTRADNGGHSQTERRGSEQQNGKSTADAGGRRETRADNGGRRVQDSRRDNSTLPPAVPRGDAHASDLISDPVQVKGLICEKILGGRNPARLWSGDAENRLAMMCKDAGGVSLQEILDIAVYRSTPENDAIPELRRRPVLTETSLMQHWNDELDRSRAFLAKYPRTNGAAPRKKEPDRWRDFFQHKYGAGVRLPETFDELEADLHAEWQREHEKFESEVAT